jgi:cyanophycin synthetase
MKQRRWPPALCATSEGCVLSVKQPIEADAGAEPPRAFDDSRRLTGANRYHGSTAVQLSALGRAAHDGAAQGRWAGLVHALAFHLGWPDPAPRVHEHAAGVVLAFAAPSLALFTATEINEWAWERAAPGVHAAAGFVPLHPPCEQAHAHFAARARHEYTRPLAALLQAAQAHQLPLLEDDDTVSIGEGTGCVVYPRAALPLALDVPWARLHTVPKIVVTGSNGKTTTTRLLAAIAQAVGLTPGLCGTEGVVVAGQTVASGDWAGPAGARAVLRHPAVSAALLETARGGILRRGLAVARADVALITNVSADHLADEGVDDVGDIAQVKLSVAHAVAGHGTLVLNGADDVLMQKAMQSRHATAARWALFARQHDAALLQTLRQHGGVTCGVRAGRLLLAQGQTEHDLGDIHSMPLTLGGAAGHNIENLAAAALAAALVGWPVAKIGAVLQTFGAQAQDNPGRLERWQHRGATVLLDYAHNPDGLAQLLAVARALKPRRLALLLGQAGNRDDVAINELARTAAQARPDRVVIKELPAMLRGRAPGEVTQLLERGLLAAGLKPAQLAQQSDEETAARWLLAWAQPGDVVVLPVHTHAVRAQLVALLGAQS